MYVRCKETSLHIEQDYELQNRISVEDISFEKGFKPVMLCI